MAKKPTFANLLLSFPVSPEDLPERNRTPGREFDWGDERDTPKDETKPSLPASRQSAIETRPMNSIQKTLNNSRGGEDA